MVKLTPRLAKSKFGAAAPFSFFSIARKSQLRYHPPDMISDCEIWLSLDLSSSTGSLAIHRQTGNEVACLADEIIGQGFQHSEWLFSRLEPFLKGHSLNVQQIDRFITTSGPGSFTGLRVGLAAWKAVAMAREKPLELISGSEARALAWLSGEKHLELPTELTVLTHVSLDKYVQARFNILPFSQVKLITETVVQESAFHTPIETGVKFLLDEKSRGENFSGVPAFQREIFPLRAKHLGTALTRATSRRSLVIPSDYINAGPEYFGSSF